MNDGGFLAGYAVGGVLTLLMLLVQDWLYERSINREIRASKGRMRSGR